MKETDQNLMLEEYRANVQLWMHDDNLRQQRTSNFLTINTILIAVLSALISIDPEIQGILVAAIFVSIFGIFTSLIWHRILKRNARYIEFRRLQLYHLESEMQLMSTFTNTYNAFYENKTIIFENIQKSFSLDKDRTKSSTYTEGKLPLLIILFWGVVFILAAIFIIIG